MQVPPRIRPCQPGTKGEATPVSQELKNRLSSQYTMMPAMVGPHHAEEVLGVHRPHVAVPPVRSTQALRISAWVPPLAQRSRCFHSPRRVSGISIHTSARGSKRTLQCLSWIFQLMSMSSVSMSSLQ